MSSFENMAALFRVLMHPNRLAILQVLRDGEQCVCHLEAALGLRQAYISQQLAVMRQEGLISDRRDGWNVYYRVARPEVFSVLDAAAAVEPAANPPDAIPLRARAHGCPCPKCQRLR